MISQQQPDSLWRSTATPAQKFYSLDGEFESDVTVIGGGFTGLSAALHLAELGYQVCVLEAIEVGFGASGRNGGQIIPGIKIEPQSFITKYGAKKGEAIISSTNRSARLVYELIDKYQIDCAHHNNGFIQPAFSKKTLAALKTRVVTHKQFGAPLSMLDRERTAYLLGSDAYLGALLDTDGGGLQPLSYVRGLGKSAAALSVKIFNQSPMQRILRINEKWQVETPKGKVISNNVLICTNGYGNLVGRSYGWKGLGDSVIPLYSFQVATAPLSGEIRRHILPEGHVVADTRRLLNYFRLDESGRLLMGGRGGNKEARNAQGYNHIAARITALYPELKNQDIAYYWSGRVALTLDKLPHIHKLSEGVYSGLGYNGRGVGMATLMGKWLAELVSKTGDHDVHLPLSKMRPIPFMCARKPFIQIASSIKKIQDNIEK